MEQIEKQNTPNSLELNPHLETHQLLFIEQTDLTGVRLELPVHALTNTKHSAFDTSGRSSDHLELHEPLYQLRPLAKLLPKQPALSVWH